MSDLPEYYDPEADIPTDEASRRKNCSSKATYASEELARAAAVQSEWAGGEKANQLGAYRCKYCDRWHLSRQR
jgi:hypothetical protein